MRKRKLDEMALSDDRPVRIVNLSNRVKHALTALYQALKQFPNEDTLVIAECYLQISKLRSKLQLLDGDDALVQFDARFN